MSAGVRFGEAARTRRLGVPESVPSLGDMLVKVVVVNNLITPYATIH